MQKVKRIVFVAEMRDSKKASSTQIMTTNLLFGFSRIAEEIAFVAVIAEGTDRDEITEKYTSLCDKLFFSVEKTKYKTQLIARQVSWLYRSIHLPNNVIPDGLLEIIDANTILISHTPPIDSALVCACIKKKMPELRYIQYWGDPLALTLITPEEYNFKRILLKEIEKKAHVYADRIVYGTKSLYTAEMKMFPEIANKSDYSRVSYIPDKQESKIPKETHTLLFGYFGNYFSYVRNIEPLVEAFKEIKDAKLLVYGTSDRKFADESNIIFRNRVPQETIEIEDAKLDVEVCILNNVGIQIPGKLFYHTNIDRHILVLLDGSYKEGIRKELEDSHRFIFCENNTKDIISTVRSIIDGDYLQTRYDRKYFSPEETCREILFGHERD